MKFVKYTVKIPNTNNEYNEFVFYTLHELCNFLEVSETIIYRIINGEYKYSCKKSMKLKGIIITKENISNELKEELRIKYQINMTDKQKKKEEETIKLASEFHKKLLEKDIKPFEV